MTLATRARVIALGQRLAGDDAVGLDIVDAFRAGGVPPGVEVFEIADAAGLLSLLETTCPVVIVDAVVGSGPCGELVDLDGRQIAGASDRPLSTHGLDVAGAIALSGVLFGEGACPSVHIVGVRVEPPALGSRGLSPVVGVTVAPAVRMLRARLAACLRGSCG